MVERPSVTPITNGIVESFPSRRVIHMRTRLDVVVAAALIAAGAGFVAVSGQAAQKAAAASMVVYKSPT